MPAGRARWGFHQLGRSWAARVVADAGIRPGDLVLDVGAGTGALTAPLVDCGAQVVAIERHLGRAAQLRQKFAADDVTVVVADALDLRLPKRPFRVVSNPPFGVTVALLKRLVAPGSRLERADIIVPWHTARRWAAGDAPGAGRWLRDFGVGIGRALPRSALSPPPPSGVAILVLARRTPGGQQSRFPVRRPPAQRHDGFEPGCGSVRHASTTDPALSVIPPELPGVPVGAASGPPLAFQPHPGLPDCGN